MVAWNHAVAALASCAVLLLVAGSDAFDDFPRATPPIATASTDGGAVVIAFADGGGPAPDPATVGVMVNGVLRGSPTNITADGRNVQFTWPAGFGAGDAVRLAFAGNQHWPAVNLSVANHSPPHALPTPRLDAAALQANGWVYVFGGTTPAGDDDAPLTAIQRYDPATGNVTTMAATLDRPLLGAQALWDSRESISCLTGCAYIFGGQDADGHPEFGVLRYDAGRDVLTRLPVTLPPSPNGHRIAFDGDHFIINVDGPVAGSPHAAASSEWYRFDPITSSIEAFTSTWTPLPDGAAGTGTGRHADCTQHCIFLFARWEHGRRDAPLVPLAAVGDGVSRPVRYESASGVSEFRLPAVPGEVWPRLLPTANGQIWLLEVSDCSIDCTAPAMTGVYNIAQDTIAWGDLVLPHRPRTTWAVGPTTYQIGGLVDGEPTGDIATVRLG